MQKPLFTIVIPALNEEKFLPRLLADLAAQTDRDFEVVVADGHSTDKTVVKAKAFARKLPKLTVLALPHCGLPYQRNQGAAAGSAPWLVFLDADGMVKPYFVSRMKAFITEKKPEFFTAWFHADSDENYDALIALFGNIMIEGSIRFKRPLAPGPMAAIRRSTFERIGGYTEGLEWGEDFDFTKKVTDAGTHLSVLRETIYGWSLRRFRNEGTLNVIRKFSQAAMLALIARRVPTKMKGYVMGGHLYGKKKKTVTMPIIKRYEAKLVALMRELFD